MYPDPKMKDGTDVYVSLILFLQKQVHTCQFKVWYAYANSQALNSKDLEWFCVMAG